MICELPLLCYALAVHRSCAGKAMAPLCRAAPQAKGAWLSVTGAKICQCST